MTPVVDPGRRRRRRSPTPIVVTHQISGSGVAVFPRLVVDAGADSDVTIVERFVAGRRRARTTRHSSCRCCRSAPSRRLACGTWRSTRSVPNTWQIGNQQAVGERDSSTLLATVTLGGDYVRARTEARLTGKGASTKQVALYFAGGTQMHDFRTIQDHDAPHTRATCCSRARCRTMRRACTRA